MTNELMLVWDSIFDDNICVIDSEYFKLRIDNKYIGLALFIIARYDCTQLISKSVRIYEFKADLIQSKL